MGMGDESPMRTFGYIAHRLNDWPLAYLHLVEPAVVGNVRDETTDPRWDEMIMAMREAWRGVLMLAGGYDGVTGQAALASGRADIIAFGRPFIANPDLPARIRSAAPLNMPDPATFFGGTSVGYTDYQTLD
jgi:N-ethylmaleimide reductase